MNFSGVLHIACTSSSHHQMAARPAEPGLWLALRHLSVGGAGPGPRPFFSHCSAGAGPPPRKLRALLPVRGSAHLRLPAGAWRPCRVLQGGQCPSLPVSPGRCFRSAEGSWCLLHLDVSIPSSLVFPPAFCRECGAGLREPWPGEVVSYWTLVLPAVQWIENFLLIKTLECPSRHIRNLEKQAPVRGENMARYDPVPGTPVVPSGRSSS